MAVRHVCGSGGTKADARRAKHTRPYTNACFMTGVLAGAVKKTEVLAGTRMEFGMYIHRGCT